MKISYLFIAFISFISSNIYAQIVVDYDGNIYNTVTIGSQTWMKENLKVTHYLNGTAIPNVSNTNTWKTMTSGAYCYFDNTIANGSTYGLLYNWYAATDTNKICPLGWHIPSDTDWNILTHFLDASVDTTAIGWSGTDIGGQLKETGTVLWNSPNTGATNSSGFSALPGGYRNLYGSFMYIKSYGYWWGPKTGDTINAWKRNLNFDNAQISRSSNTSNYKVSGFSCRCVMDDVVTNSSHMQNENKIEVYPNPASEKIIVVLKLTNPEIISIYNTFGECVLQKEISENENAIDISTLSIGFYIIKINNGNNLLFKKFVKD